MQQTVLPSLHDSLLLRYTAFSAALSSTGQGKGKGKEGLARLLASSRPSVRFFEGVFAGDESDPEVLGLVYERWRSVKGQEAEAGLCWAEWLVRHGEGAKAGGVFRQALGAAPSEAREGMEARWRGVLDAGSGDIEMLST